MNLPTKRFWLLCLWLVTWPASWAATDQPATPAVGFDIRIEAPTEMAQLLSRHLELQRYRELTDLSVEELDRLQDVAKDDARQLLGTLGYFSPAFTLSARTIRRVRPLR